MLICIAQLKEKIIAGTKKPLKKLCHVALPSNWVCNANISSKYEVKCSIDNSFFSQKCKIIHLMT